MDLLGGSSRAGDGAEQQDDGSSLRAGEEGQADEGAEDRTPGSAHRLAAAVGGAETAPGAGAAPPQLPRAGTGPRFRRAECPRKAETVLAARTLAAEERQFDVGLRTSTDVLDASASLADAQSREVLALASYQIALVDLSFATGTSLGAARIRFEPIADEEMDALEKATEAPAAMGGAAIDGNP